MKAFLKDFLFRGLIAASGGPIVLAIIYGILGATNTVSQLTPTEVCLGIITITLLAFMVAGMTAIYQLEQLPLISAILIHGASLYATYLIIYLINGWLLHQLFSIGIFKACFIIGYAIIWLLIYLFTKANTTKLSQELHNR